MENQALVKDVSVMPGRHFTPEHVQKVRGDVVFGFWLDGFKSFSQPIAIRHERWKLPGQSRSSCERIRSRNVARGLVVKLERRDRGSQNIDGIRLARKATHEIDNLDRQHVVLNQRVFQLRQFGRGWQAFVPKQKNDFLESRVANQIVNVVPLVNELALL